MRRTATVLFALSILLSISLLAAYEAAIASYYRGEASFLTAIFKPGPSLARSTSSADSLFREFNALLLTRPEEAITKAALERVGARAGPLIVALRVGSTVSYASRPIAPEALGDLPSFGSLEQEALQDEDTGDGRLYAIRQLDFRTASGEAASFFILRVPAPPRDRHIPYTRQLALVVALLLLAADGAVGVFFILRITASLGKLEAAALRIGGGDLATKVGSNNEFAELASVFAVLETMRTEIADLLSRARAHESERRELIANLSHDLRTPIAAVRGYVDGLREGIADTPEKSGRYLSVISDKVKVLERMIGEIFLLSTLDEGEAAPERRHIDLSAFLRSGIDELRLALPTTSAILADLDIEGAGDFIVDADPNQLKRVVENIVDNSLRHGGRSPIGLAFKLSRLGDKALLRIEDDGCGIEEAERAAVFERFYRGRAERPGGGAGLGLAIARRLVEANGGTIRAVDPGSGRGGAVIVIELALVEAGR